MADLKIVAADGIKGEGIDMMTDAFGSAAIEVRGKFSEDELCEKIKDMDALLIRSGTTVTRKAIEAAGPRLKVIGRAGVGTDNIDKEAATERGIVVMNTPMGNTLSAAEQAIALIFATARNIARADSLMQQNNWDKKALVGVEVNDKVLGLIGMGKIGGHVGKVMKAAGMKVLAYDPFLPPETAKLMGVELADLDTILAKSDFISLHTPLTDQTRDMLNLETLKKTKKGVRIINCARGGIINEAALGEMVASGHIAAAGVDVFTKEPMTEGPLFGVKDLTLTPHLGASTAEATNRCSSQMAEQVIAYFNEGIILNPVNISIPADKTLKPYVPVASSIGKIASTLLNSPLESLEISCSGELAEKNTAEITAAATMGAMSTFGAEDVNVVNAMHMAKQRGVKIKEVSCDSSGLFTNRIDVIATGGGKKCQVAGTSFSDAIPRLIQIDDAEMDIKLAIGGTMMFVRYPDVPGYVGKFGTLLAEENINITNMEVGSLDKLERASTVIGLNSPASDAVMDKIRAIDGVERAYQISL